MTAKLVDRPLVSVVIPTHDRPQWLAVAVGSALAQTYAPIEVRVVDDGGRPETAAALAPLADPRLHHDLATPGRGLAWNHRAALERARGEYVVFLSDDDALDAEFVARRMTVALADPGLAVVFSGYTIADAELRPVRRCEPPLSPDRPLEWEELVGAALGRHWSINSSLYRVEQLRTAWPVEDEVGNAFDTALHLRLALLQRARGAFGSWCDVAYRTHPGQESRGEATLRHYVEGERMYRHVLKLPMSGRIRARVHTDFANWQILWARTLSGVGQRAAARKRLVRAVLTAPWVRGAWTQLGLSWLAPGRVRMP